MFPSKMVAPLILAGAVLFNFIFWQELLALNALLFDAFIISAVCFYYPRASKDNAARWMLLAHILCLFTVLWHNSLLSKIAYGSTLLLFIGFAQYAHRSIWYAGGSVALSIFLFAYNFQEKVRVVSKINKKKKFGKFIRLAIFPTLLLLLFFVIYNFANGVLSEWTSHMGLRLDTFLLNFFNQFSIDRFFFLFFGFYITGSLLLRTKLIYFENKEAIQNNDLTRIRFQRRDPGKNWWYEVVAGIMGKLAKGVLALKNENTVGIVSLILLNILLLAVNAIDIGYLWFNFTYTPGVNLSDLTHQGTELLIVSIVLAMSVLLFFFRGNLNFYGRNKWLKLGAYGWIVQNVLLVISVFIRDYYYIARLGLSYKRIGIFFFLVMVLTGLITVFIKINKSKTGYFLCRINAWMAVLLLVIGSSVNWDVYIAKYNISHRENIPLDITYLLTFSDKTLPVLAENRQVLRDREKELNNNKVMLARCVGCIDEIINSREAKYLEEQWTYTWLSYNYTDATIKKRLEKEGDKISNK
jgi:Domain of unknown function (DUF4173)